MGVGHHPAASLARAVFLDRDGTLNRVVVRNGKAYPPGSLEAFELYPGVPEALGRLKAAGLLLVVVTNQPDVGAGRQEKEIVEAIHLRMRALLPLDDVRVCFHTDDDRCGCRKPRAGMLEDAAALLRIDLRRSYMVGDRWRDIEAGRAVGCRTVFIRNDYDERQPDSCDLTVDSLVDAAQAILLEIG